MLAIIVEGEKEDNYVVDYSASIFSLHYSALFLADEQQVLVIQWVSAGEHEEEVRFMV